MLDAAPPAAEPAATPSRTPAATLDPAAPPGGRSLLDLPVLKDRLVLTLTSAFGLGYAPFAPGTFGSLAALPLWWATASWSPPVFVAACLMLTGLAVALCGRAEKIYGAHDVQRIVLDEVVGLMWTVVAVPCTPRNAVWAFVTFRLLDACKPGPIGWVDRRVGGGLGVVLDDVAAGFVGLLALHAGHAAGLLPW